MSRIVQNILQYFPVSAKNEKSNHEILIFFADKFKIIFEFLIDGQTGKLLFVCSGLL